MLNMNLINKLGIAIAFVFIGGFISCNSPENTESDKINAVTVAQTPTVSGDILSYADPNLEGPSVLIFNFHSTNRCISCNAIEANTRKTLETYFSKEMQEGRIKMMVYNVDDEVNASIAQTFEATGTALFIVRVNDGKDSIMDVTGDGFKYAKHNPEKLIEILKSKIEEQLQ